MPRRNVTEEDFDPRERYVLYRLCDCNSCNGSGKAYEVIGSMGPPLPHRCPDCRGEGRVRQEVAACASPEAVGVALVTLAREGEFEGCQFGLLDRGGEKNQRWLVLPWPQTARTVSAAGRLLRSSQSQ